MITSGFFNSVNGDRKYNAEQMSAIFDGIINDGVFMGIGTAFSVAADTGNQVSVGIGRAWLNSTWVFNPTVTLVELDESDLLTDRIDAVVLEVNHNPEVRASDIKVVKGTPATSPARPTLIKSKNLNQYPLAYILRPKNSTAITQANITYMVGSGELPFVTGILQTMNIDNLVAQWGEEWREWLTAVQNETAENITQDQADWDTWFANIQSLTTAGITENQEEWDAWFNGVRDTLTEDAAGNLYNMIVEVQNTYLPLTGGSLTGDTEIKNSKSIKLTSQTGKNAIATLCDSGNGSGYMYYGVKNEETGDWTYNPIMTFGKEAVQSIAKFFNIAGDNKFLKFISGNMKSTNMIFGLTLDENPKFYGAFKDNDNSESYKNIFSINENGIGLENGVYFMNRNAAYFYDANNSNRMAVYGTNRSIYISDVASDVNIMRISGTEQYVDIGTSREIVLASNHNNSSAPTIELNNGGILYLRSVGSYSSNMTHARMLVRNNALCIETSNTSGKNERTVIAVFYDSVYQYSSNTFRNGIGIYFNSTNNDNVTLMYQSGGNFILRNVTNSTNIFSANGGGMQVTVPFSTNSSISSGGQINATGQINANGNIKVANTLYSGQNGFNIVVGTGHLDILATLGGPTTWGFVRAAEYYGDVLKCRTDSILYLSSYSSSRQVRVCGSRLEVIPAIPAGGGLLTYSPVHASEFAKLSSVFVKEDINNISDEEAKKILDLRPVSFIYKGDENKKEKFGLIAEEVLDIIPKLVLVEDGYNTEEIDPENPDQSKLPALDYSNFVPHLISMVQIQQKQIDTLTAKVERLEAVLNKMLS